MLQTNVKRVAAAIGIGPMLHTLGSIMAGNLGPRPNSSMSDIPGGDPTSAFSVAVDTVLWASFAMPGVLIWWWAHHAGRRNWPWAVLVALVFPGAPVLFLLPQFVGDSDPRGVQVAEWLNYADLTLTLLIAVVMWFVAYKRVREPDALPRRPMP